MVDTKEHATAKSTIVDVANVGAPGTDVQTCITSDERLLAASTQGTGGKQDSGRVLIYTVATDGKLTAKSTVTDSSTTPPTLGADRHSLYHMFQAAHQNR